jgi:sigma-54-specific transcriptional regulator
MQAVTSGKQRERLRDASLLAEPFPAAGCGRENVRKCMTPAALEKLASKGWPGSVRELRNVVQCACVGQG